jgi:hypothetical protein
MRASPHFLAVARIMIGLCSFAVAWEVWRMLSRLLNPQMLQLPYFTWLPRIPSNAVLPLVALWLIASAAFLVGYKTRLAGAIITFLSGYILFLDQQTYSNHLYLFFLIVSLLTVAGSGAALSIDRPGDADDVPAWPILLLKVQVSLVYGFSALAKLTPQFLSGEVLSQTLRQNGWLVFPQSLRTSQLLTVLAIAAIILELFIAIALWIKRVRAAAVLAGVILHVFIISMLDSSRLSLSIFAWEMFALYPLFFQRLKTTLENKTKRPNSTPADQLAG